MELVIGLEVHIKLNSETKLFCSCKNEQEFLDLAPNSHICPTCTGQPGALPVVQQNALEKGILLGLALGCTISPTLRFDRKSYFYPDLPMGYQITQVTQAISTKGEVPFFLKNFEEMKRVNIKQAHLENDTAKTIHDDTTSYLDFNRSGTPLVEIVTDPDFRSDEEVTEFLKELQRIVRWNNVGFADLEKGQMRCDVNISIRDQNLRTKNEFGTRVELKNINSFGAIKRAIQHEYARQVSILEAGGTLDQETRGRDDMKGESFVMRSKENALDYRYFPEPDLPEVRVPQELVTNMKGYLVSSPFATIAQFKNEYGFNKEFINGLISDWAVMKRFEQCVQAGITPKTAAKWIVGPIGAHLNEHAVTINTLPFELGKFLEFLKIAEEKKLLDNQLKLIMETMLQTGESAETVIKAKGFDQENTIDLQSLAQQVIAENEKVVAEYKGGKLTTMGFLVGQLMKKAAGRANPNEGKKVLEGLLTL